MQFIQRLLGFAKEQEIPKPKAEPQSIPKANLEVERELFRAQNNSLGLWEALQRLETEQQELSASIKKLTLEGRVLQARKVIRDMNENRKKLDDSREKLRLQRLRKTSLQVDRMKLTLEHEFNKAQRFMRGMLQVNKMMKSLNPKEVQGSLEYTNQLIKTLAGDRESEQLKKFHDNIAEEEEQKKQNTLTIARQNSYVDPNLSDDGMSAIRRSSVKGATKDSAIRLSAIKHLGDIKQPHEFSQKAVLASIQRPRPIIAESASAGLGAKHHPVPFELPTPKSFPAARSASVNKQFGHPHRRIHHEKSVVNRVI